MFVSGLSDGVSSAPLSREVTGLRLDLTEELCGYSFECQSPTAPVSPPPWGLRYPMSASRCAFRPSAFPYTSFYANKSHTVNVHIIYATLTGRE